MRTYYKEGGSVKTSPAWTRKEGKSDSGGLNKKGVESYRKANPGSKLKTAVTKDPSKLKAGSKDANRRKSFCARMSGMKKTLRRLTIQIAVSTRVCESGIVKYPKGNIS
jgi:hypothetical protein